jgi:hypothetical protein
MSARARIEGALVYLSWLGRHGLAVATLVLAGRGLALGIAAATPEEAIPRGSLGRASSSKDPENPLDLSQAGSKLSFEDIQKLGGNNELGRSSKTKPELQIRSVVVDFGPARSEVFINGGPVGRTPYAGQVSCRLGDTFRVDVVPPKGLPIHKDMRCLKSEPEEFPRAPAGTVRPAREAGSSRKVP